ncbi:F-box/LRR-repeat protein 5 isoform X2 [Scleropages formosus]|uniref:F-box/LRR-repeat protein 5 n=1 Tax=Scleropages formosus TaxID=113540 RepID=A0A8C9SC79_SCLFO|nr:F-box/LRR-repeat protein 5 isoform X2 [Scleropages formosus]
MEGGPRHVTVKTGMAQPRLVTRSAPAQHRLAQPRAGSKGGSRSGFHGVKMAPFPDEVDVFTGPHWRMKQLVGLYCEKLSKTNFSNNSDFRSFLQSLLATFREFKMHEQIENDYIIGLLQQRSRTVYNVHSDNKLSEMLSLFEKGLRNVKNEYEQLNYAQQLKERLDAFTQDFLPHMKEEEEVFQPMLMQYFSYEELKAIKQEVMAQHRDQGGRDHLKALNLWNQAQELQRAFKYSLHEKWDEEPEKSSEEAHISGLPPEVLLKLFHYLSPEDLSRCAQVCSSWSRLTKTGSLWRHLHPVRWARGDYYRGPPGNSDQEPDDDWVRSRQDESRAYQEWDEDADIDESEESAVDSAAINTCQREKRLLNGMIQYLLPEVGPYVKSAVLAYSSAVSSKMVRQILNLCPNLSHLDLTQTDITDSAFDSWSTLGTCRLLEHVDLSGCDKITDLTLKRLSLGLGDLCSSGTPPASGSCTKQPRGLRQEGSGGARQALVFKRRPGSLASMPTYVWVLDPVQLADIEDAAEWRRGLPEKGGGSCCCRRRGFRTSSTACWPQYVGAGSGQARCGHSSCCGGEAALRTVGALWETPVGLRTKGEVSHSGHAPTDQKTVRQLRFLSLSGCYHITDLGLRLLSQRGGLPHLEHLNLSGCLFITEVGLQELVLVCPSLNDEQFYYCDNINGPHADTASGCQNLQCGFRACCRSGE